MNVQLSIKEIMTVNVETVQQNDKMRKALLFATYLYWRLEANEKVF